jgi:hypothetical protein
MDWHTIIIATLTSTTFVGLLTWAIQTYFQNKNEIRLKVLEADLAKKAFVHSKVFETTQKAVNEVYKLIPEMRRNVLGYLMVLNKVAASDDDEKKARATYNITSDALKECLEANRLYIPQLTAENLGMYRMEMDGIIARGFCERQRSKDKEKEAMQLMFHFGLVDTLYRHIESDLQSILGFPTDPSKMKWNPSWTPEAGLRKI